MTPGRLLFTGFMAGACIAFGFMLAVIAGCIAKLPPFVGPDGTFNKALLKILLGAVFPVGLIMICIGGADLWTGNAQVVPYGRMTGKTDLKKVIYNWIGSYGGNFIGSVFLAFLAVFGTGLFLNNIFADTAIGIAKTKVSLGWWKAFWRGVGCNWLVNMAVWLYARSNDYAGKWLGIWFPIFAFVAIGFEHSIANMWVIPTAIFASNYAITWTDFILNNLIPVTIGNAVGGFIFVALYYWWLCALKDGKVYGATLTDALRYIVEIQIIATLVLVALLNLVPLAIAYAIDVTAKNVAMWLTPTIISIYIVILTFAFHRLAWSK